MSAHSSTVLCSGHNKTLMHMASAFSGSEDHSRSLEKGFHCSSNADPSLCKYRPRPIRCRPQSVLNSNPEKQPEKSGGVLSWKTAAMQHSGLKEFARKEAAAAAEALAKYEYNLSYTFVQDCHGGPFSIHIWLWRLSLLLKALMIFSPVCGRQHHECNKSFPSP